MRERHHHAGSRSYASEIARYVALAVALSSTYAGAQPPELGWLKQYGTTGNSSDILRAAASDADGNVYAAGQTTGNYAVTNLGQGDIIILKYSPSGALLASRQLGTSLNDDALAIHVGSTGVWVGGSTEGDLDGAGPQTHVGSGSIADAYLLRLGFNLEGTPFIRQFGSTAADVVRDIEGDGESIYAVGDAGGALGGEGGASSGNLDAFLIKLAESDGAEGWRRQFGTSIADQAFGVAVYGVGDSAEIYVAGGTNANQPGSAVAFVRRYDAAGNEIWRRSIDGISAAATAASADEIGVFIAGREDTGTDSNVFVRKLRRDGSDDADWPAQDAVDAYPPAIGAFPGRVVLGSTLNSPPVPQFDQPNAVLVRGSAVSVAGFVNGSLFATNMGGRDGFAASFDPGDGTFLWGQQIGSPVIDSANALAAHGAVVFVAGEADALLPDASTTGSIGGPDGFVRALDGGDGSKIWAVQSGSAGPVNDFARAVASDDGRVCVFGDVNAALPGESYSGLNDPYLRVFDPDTGAFDGAGPGSTTTQFGSPGFENGRAVFIHPTAGTYVVGFTDGRLPNPDGTLQTKSGVTDAFIARFLPDGTLDKVVEFGTPDFDQANGVTGDASSIYVVGTRGQSGAADVIVWKLDLSLSMPPIFTQVFVSPGADLGNAISFGPNGLYIAGQITCGAPTCAGADAFVRRLNPADGSEVWLRLIRTAGADNAFGVAQNQSGVFLAGQLGGSLPSPQPVLAGPSDAFVAKFDFQGTPGPVRVIQSALADGANAASADGYGVYVTGTAGAALPAGDGFLTSSGGVDAFVVKYGDDLDERWRLQFGSTATDNPLGISASRAGVFVVGTTTGTLPGQTSAGANDAFAGSLYVKVGIDVKPGSFPNIVKLTSKGTVPVAILSSAGFDASMVDPTTVTLAGAQVKQESTGAPLATLQDVNADGLLDLMVHVVTGDLGLPASGEAVLTGLTYEGDHVRGVNTITSVK